MESLTTYEKLFPTFFNDVTLTHSDNLDAEKNLFENQHKERLNTPYYNTEQICSDSSITTGSFSALHLNIRSMQKNFES